jgi:hypothetical protein
MLDRLGVRKGMIVEKELDNRALIILVKIVRQISEK